jgi:hypothetical protein
MMTMKHTLSEKMDRLYHFLELTTSGELERSEDVRRFAGEGHQLAIILLDRLEVLGHFPPTLDRS